MTRNKSFQVEKWKTTIKMQNNVTHKDHSPTTLKKLQATINAKQIIGKHKQRF